MKKARKAKTVADYAILVFTNFNMLRNSASWAFRRRIENLHKMQVFKILLCALRNLQYNRQFRAAIFRRQFARNRVRVQWQMYYHTLFATKKKPYISKKIEAQLTKLINSRRFIAKLRSRFNTGEFKVIYNFYNRE